VKITITLLSSQAMTSLARTHCFFLAIALIGAANSNHKLSLSLRLSMGFNFCAKTTPTAFTLFIPLLFLFFSFLSINKGSKLYYYYYS